MPSTLQITVVAVIAIVIFYLILGSVLAFTWNRSVAKLWGVQHELGVIEALFLLVTMHILFGSFNQGSGMVYNIATNGTTTNPTTNSTTNSTTN